MPALRRGHLPDRLFRIGPGRKVKPNTMDSTPHLESPQLFGLTEARRKSIRRWVFGSMALLMLAGVAVGFLPYYAVSREMRSFCGSLAVGSPLADVQSLATTRGYAVVPGGDGRVLLKVPQLAPQVPSSRGCDLRVGPAGGLVSATYSDSL